jgi:hypothetical protein
MRKQRHSKAEGTVAGRLWTYAETAATLPYLRSIARSLREHWLEWQRQHLRVRRLDEQPGRPGRQALLLRAEASEEAERAEERFEEALKELLALGAYSLDPTKGLVLIPFRQRAQLAWFVFDLFAPQGVEGWRFQSDPLTTRRPLAEIVDDRPGSAGTNDASDAVLVDQVFSEDPWS